MRTNYERLSDSSSASGGPRSDLTESVVLLQRFQAGDVECLDRLWARYLPRLKRWAHGRLPPPSRGATATDDLVQDAFVRSLAHLRTFQPRNTYSLVAYFRTIILNEVRDFARQASSRPRQEEIEPDVHVDRGPSPLEQALGAQALERYERARATLSPGDQEIVVAFVELRCTDAEIMELFEKPTIDAARRARGRALMRLAKAMET
jgi:RNA polymerase sigma-70 factor (ECF subfamily)